MRAFVHKAAASEEQINVRYHQPAFVSAQSSVSRHAKAARGKRGGWRKDTQLSAAFPIG